WVATHDNHANVGCELHRPRTRGVCLQELCLGVSRQQLLHHPTLRFDLRGSRRTSISVQGDDRSRMPQQFLNQSNITSIRYQRARKSSSKGVEADRSSDPGSSSSRLEVISHQHVCARWFSSLQPHAGKDEILIGRIWCFVAPCFQ